jgi:hypothetical protein
MSKLITTGEDRSEFHQKISEAINACSVDTELNIPDFILADYVVKNLHGLKIALQHSAQWKGEKFEFTPGGEK